ncbi:MAG: hypothetical protein GY786_07505 [Proteobacteria bacterium]|nr:hypothetical protein [Pseudomonadota bacterium]
MVFSKIYGRVVILFCAFIFFGILPFTGVETPFLTGQVAMAQDQDESCPPELCEEEEQEQANDEDEENCPPEACDEEEEADEDCPPEACAEEEEEEEDCPPEVCAEGEEGEAEEEYIEEEVEEKERTPVDRTLYSRLTGAMRNNMYQHVADDKEIEAVEKWISDGRLNDSVFINTIRPIMKENCSKCHSTSSTMSKGIAELPLTNYSEIVAFTKLAQPDSSCLECHGLKRLKDHRDEKLASIYVGGKTKEHSAHSKVPCIRCHYDLHKEYGTYCQDPKAFTNLLASWTQGSNAKCAELKKPDCVKCHLEQGDKMEGSVHFNKDGRKIELLDQEGNALKVPGCIDCHRTHDVVTSKQDKSNLNIVENCGNCHNDLVDSYFSSYHGKAALLGSEKTAKCADCHGSHEMVAIKNEKSPVHEANIEKICKECHKEANENFVAFIPHADHYNKDKYPILYWAFWIMTSLILLVFAAFGIHTFLWFYRSIVERGADGKEPEVRIPDPPEKHVRRFNISHTLLHLMVVVSFLMLALTGMSLKFADNSMFQWISHAVGGPHMLGQIHRIGAMITLAYLVSHLIQLLSLFIRKKITLMGLFKEDYTMVPLARDFRDIKANILYFLGKGPKPVFGRWTYWEKFDYLAVFWGVTIIGISGLVLWFPESTTEYLPGWSINLATIIHSDEALLATIFIFVVHFFHTHLRPEALPLDTVIFTQKMPLSKFKEERPLEYQSLVEKNELEGRLLPPPSSWYAKFVQIWGFGFLSIGIFLVLAIFYSLIF